MAGLLEGVRVIEVGALMTVDNLGRLLGDEGADVIKVESPQFGDYMRNIETRFAPDWSVFHLVLNRNKRSVAVDARHPDGQEVVARLISDADVFISGNVGASNSRLGLDYEAVRAMKSDIVYCRATGFGASGPYAEIPTHGQMMDDLAGAGPQLDVVDGTVRGGGQEPVLALGCVLGPLYAAFGIAAALARVARTGQSCYIDVSCADSVFANQWLYALQTFNPDLVDPNSPSGDTESAKYQYYETKDERILLFCAIEPKFWDHFCRAIGRPDLAGDHDRSHVVDFASGDETLRRELQEIFRARCLDEWMRLAVEHDIPMGPALTLSETQVDPQLQARDMLVTDDHPVVGAFVTLGNPLRVAGESFTIRPAPAHGGHTDEVLTQIGYTTAEVARLRAAGAIA